MRKNGVIAALLSIVLLLAAGCGANNTSNDTTGNETSKEKKKITFGATAGPYSDMVTKAIKPIMEAKGYALEVIEFNDYVQPNKALAGGSLDANLFQHIIYLKKFAEDNKLDLVDVISVPTAPMGLYSKKFKTVEEITDGAELAIANDPANLARSLLLLQDLGLIKVKADADPTKISEKDIAENPKNLKISLLEAAQLPRTVEGTDLAVVAGNFALAAKMDLNSAIKLENMAENYRNVIAINTKDSDGQFVKDLKETVESDEFERAIDEYFQGFSKPEWMAAKQ
ncbi:D-methionine-binding lipoprotein MetQ [Paenibacillus plantiphilus]|uniref:Lipoprotein n=1 Tax=Paenibacillus plantiphilus TaxID=2905650 RepID=A0ABM9C2B5_9BACL|nr:MetQ/NlpA family ABC transporter substrate-binding protein [Paenibacillus plantiphilus]CAH1201985.1 D-methionine-binding lipoprotein MetQ [Paenibacillus plantiphilus]